jgi:hypothetical protein
VGCGAEGGVHEVLAGRLGSATSLLDYKDARGVDGIGAGKGKDMLGGATPLGAETG